MENEIRQKCYIMEAEMKQKCDAMEQEVTARCMAMDQKAKEDVDKRWEELSRKLEDFYNAHQGIRELLATAKL